MNASRALLVLVLITVTPGYCALLYDFAVTPTEGPVQAVSFSLVSDGPLLPGPLTFAPFDVTVAGGTTQTISQGGLGALPTGSLCFFFGTSGTISGFEPTGCNVGGNPPNSLFLAFNFSPTPAAAMDHAGSYALLSPDFLAWGGLDPSPVRTSSIFGRGNLTLIITEVPEGCTFGLTGLGLALLVRRAANRTDGGQAASARIARAVAISGSSSLTRGSGLHQLPSFR